MQKLPLFSSKGNPFLDTISEILSDLFVSLCTLIASLCHALSRGFFANHKRVSKAPETFQADKAIFSSSVSKNREAYTPEISCTKKTSVRIKNM